MNVQMDLTADSSIKAATGGPEVESEYPFYIPQEVDSGLISLQLLDFKSRLLEAVEELHIHKDAETRNQNQMSMLVLENQELEWQKESLQRQMETMAAQHAESLASVNKQFQIKLRDVEGEKGRYQLSTELKDKETSNLREELKQLQLFKYSLEKKISELDQKLHLQTQSRARHLSQLGEVERRFTALSRQCALLKQAHAKLEQNVDEAMRQNKKLFSLNSRKESTIKTLKQSLEELNNKLIRARVSSEGRSEKSQPAATEQLIQQLQHRLHVEKEMNRKLGEENAAERTAKQEVLTSLQHTQQLLLVQTQAVCRAEQELHVQREQYQNLKGEHEVMQARVDAKEDRSSVLADQSRNTSLVWGNQCDQKPERLEQICCEQQDLSHVQEVCHSLSQDTQEVGKPNQSPERGGPSSHGSDVTAVEAFGEMNLDQTKQFHPTQYDQQDKPSDAVSSMESQSGGQTSSSQVTLPQPLSVYSPGCLNPEPGRTGEDGRHSEDKPSPQLYRPGSKEGLHPSQARGQPGVTDSLVTETATVVDVLMRPICGAPEGQPGESKPEARPSNPSLGERRDSDPTVLCGSLDHACRSRSVAPDECPVWRRLSCSDNGSVSSGAEGSGPAVKVAKDDKEEEEEGVMEGAEKTAKLQTCARQEPRHTGGLSPPEDVDRHDPEAHPHMEASLMETEREVRRHACDESRSLSPSKSQSQDGAETPQADPPQPQDSDEKLDTPVEGRQGVWNSSLHEPTACQNTSPESAPVTGACEAPAKPRDTELDPGQSPPHLASSTPPQASSTPRLASSTPPQASSTPPQASSTPRLASSTPPQASSTPPQASSTPHPASSTPPQASSTSNLSSSTPRLASSTPPQASSTLHPASSTPPQASSTPHLASSIRHLASSPSFLASSPPHLASSPPNLASSTHADLPSLTRQAMTLATSHQHAEARSSQAERPVPAPDEVDVPLRVSQPTDVVCESRCSDIDLLASSKKYRSAFDWAAQNRSRNKLAPPDKDQATSQKPSLSDLNIRQPNPSLPSFLQGRQDSRDAVMMQSRAAAYSAARPLSSIRGHQAITEAFRDTSAEQEGRVSISVSSPRIPQHSTATSRLPWQPNNSSSGGCPGLELSGSQDVEDTQQSDIRAQITRIEQFLSSEQFQTPKRRRTDLS